MNTTPISRRTLTGAVATLVLGLMLTAGVARGAGQLWLYPESQDPRQGGHVIETGSFTLVVENRTDGGNHDNTVYDAFLVFAVNDAGLFSGGSIQLADGSEAALDPAGLQIGTPVLPCSGHSAPRHSIYPTPFTTVFLGDIAAEEVRTFEVELAGGDGLRAHFDAAGVGYRETGQGMKCYDVINPSGHDVTVVLGEGDDPPCERLEVSKQANATGIDLGDELEYRITVTNDGDCALTEILGVDEIPTVVTDDGEAPAFSVVSVVPPASSQTDRELVWELGTLEPGDGVEILLTVVFDQPVTDQTEVVNRVCLTAAELDQPRCARSVVAVGDADDEIGGPGFWCNQIRFALEGRLNAQFTIEDLEALMATVDERSIVFSELWDASTLELVRDLLCNPAAADGSADRLARHLLTLWLNVVSERLDPDLTLAELCEGSAPEPSDLDPEMTIAEVLDAAEAALENGADDATLGAWAELIDFINNAHVDHDGSCHGVRRSRGRRI
jgi:uncharacterized repeat protein (TIGR01451 family)